VSPSPSPSPFPFPFRSPCPGRRLHRPVLAAFAALLLATGLPAQELGTHAKGDIGASLYFGATQQQIAAVAGELSRGDSALAVTIGLKYRYGESSDADGVRSVFARSVAAALTSDLQPFSAVSPFLLANAERSLEQRLARRLSGGAGVKWTLVRSEPTRASLSAALLAEYIRPMPEDGVMLGTDDTTRARWSFRGKYDRIVAPGVTLSHVTFYQPALTAMSRYRLSTTTRAAYALMQGVSATLTFADLYDSEARGRGARSNNDGQLLFGFSAER
jgi:hypothetical protein